MRPTFLGFNAAYSGLVASQKALDITGQNISNMNTPAIHAKGLTKFPMPFTVQEAVTA